MKIQKKWVMIGGFFLFGSGLFAQEGIFSSEKDLLCFSVEQSSIKPVEKELTSSEKSPTVIKPKWGGFGGPMGLYFQFDLSPLKPLTEERGIDEFDDQLFLIGGMGGAIYKDFRFGGFGFGGEQLTEDRVDNETRKARVSLGGGGVFVEYNHSFTKKFGLLAGTMLGAGEIELEAKGPDMGTEEKWSADGGIFLAYPYLGLWLAPTDWFWIQLNGGYLYFELDTSRSEFWNDELDRDMVDGDLKGGFQAGLQLLFGYNPNP